MRTRSTWVAQLVKHLILGFGSGHDLRSQVIRTQVRAAWVAQQFSTTFGPGCDPGDLGSSPTSHIGLPAGSLLLPLHVPLPLSVCVSHE